MELKENKIHKNYIFYTVHMFIVFLAVTFAINKLLEPMIKEIFSLTNYEKMNETMNVFLNTDNNFIIILAYGFFSMWYLFKFFKAVMKEHAFLSENKLIKNKTLHTIWAIIILSTIAPLYLFYPLYFNKLLGKKQKESFIKIGEEK